MPHSTAPPSWATTAEPQTGVPALYDLPVQPIGDEVELTAGRQRPTGATPGHA